MIVFVGIMTYLAPRYFTDKPVAPVTDMKFLDLYQENGYVSFRLDGIKQTNDRLGGLYASWRFSDLTMVAGEPLVLEETGGPGGTAIRVAGEHFVSAEYRVRIDQPGTSRTLDRLNADPGAQFRLCFVYPAGDVELQCFEVPVADIPEGPYPVPGISQTIPTVTFPRVLGFAP